METQALLSSLITLSESRGKEAAGLCIRDDREMSVYKEASRGTAFKTTKTFQATTGRMLSADNLSRSPVAAIGHTRLVTNGSMERNENNQPVVRGGMVCIHNGIIVNDGKLFEEHGLRRTCDVDTEVLLALVEQSRAKGGAIPPAVAQAFGEIKGTASVAMLFDDTPVLLLATNNGSLYSVSGERGTVFASERAMLEQVVKAHGTTFGLQADSIAHVEPGTGVLIDISMTLATPFRFDQAPQRANR